MGSSRAGGTLSWSDLQQRVTLCVGRQPGDFIGGQLANDPAVAQHLDDAPFLDRRRFVQRDDSK